MTAEEFYLDEHKGVFYGDPVIERAIFRFAEAYAEQEIKELTEENAKLREINTASINDYNELKERVDKALEYSEEDIRSSLRVWLMVDALKKE